MEGEPSLQLRFSMGMRCLISLLPSWMLANKKSGLSFFAKLCILVQSPFLGGSYNLLKNNSTLELPSPRRELLWLYIKETIWMGNDKRYRQSENTDWKADLRTLLNIRQFTGMREHKTSKGHSHKKYTQSNILDSWCIRFDEVCFF